MECRADGFGRDIAGCIHKMGVALGHFQRMMAQPVCNGELRLPTTGQPRGIGMPQGMEDNTLPSVLNFQMRFPSICLSDDFTGIIQPKFIHSTVEGFRRSPHDTTISRWEKQSTHWAFGQIAQSHDHFICHDRVSRASAFGFSNIEGIALKAHISPAQAGNLAKAQAAMHTHQCHQPCPMAPSLQFIEQSSGLLRRKETLSRIVGPGQGQTSSKGIGPL